MRFHPSACDLDRTLDSWTTTKAPKLVASDYQLCTGTFAHVVGGNGELCRVSVPGAGRGAVAFMYY